MLNAPTIPHDNVYKFIAFSGLAIMIAVSYFYYSTFRETFRLGTDLIKGQRIAVDQMNDASAGLVRLEKEIDAELAKEHSNPSETQKLIQQRDILFAHVNELRDRFTALDADKAFFENKVFDFKFAQINLILGFVFGLICFGYGLYLWYVRIQIPQDSLLAKQSEAKSNPQRRRRSNLI